MGTFARLLETSTASDTTILATAPPSGLAPIAADGTTNESAALQALLTWVDVAYGGGQVRLPSGVTIKCNSGLTVPTGVQLVSDASTVLDFSGIGSGTAITVNDSERTPLIGVNITGPNSTASLSDTSIGISVTGIQLRFYDVQVSHFGRGIDLAHSETFIINFSGGFVDRCGTGVYADHETAATTNAGEGIGFSQFSVSNSAVGINVSGNGTQFHLTDNSRIDFCTKFGIILNAWVYFTAFHLETIGASGGLTYLFDVSGNSHVSMSNGDVIMGASAGSALTNLFNPSNGPANYSYGLARFSNVTVFYQNPSSVSGNVFSEHMYPWTASTTTANFHTPFPLKWCAVSADFCVTDGYTQPNTDRVQITAMGGGAGTFTLTTPSNANQRWIRVHF